MKFATVAEKRKGENSFLHWEKATAEGVAFFAFELGGRVFFSPLLLASQSTTRRILVYRVIPNGFGSPPPMCYHQSKMRCPKSLMLKNLQEETCKDYQFI